MATYIKFRHLNRVAIGKLEGEIIQLCRGSLFDKPRLTGESIALSEAEILPPCEPQKFLALWNNFYARASAEGQAIPPHPLYFVKTVNSWNAHQQAIRQPAHYSGAVVFEGELGIVIGKSCSSVTEAEADDYILGYTCVNDVTAKENLFSDASFPQWTRAKNYDGFAVFGPGIVTDIKPDDLVIQSILDGELKQSYPVSDMIYSPRQIVSKISHDMTLAPGDVIACGTSLGAGPMLEGQSIEIKIDGVGSLVNIMTTAGLR